MWSIGKPLSAKGEHAPTLPLNSLSAQLFTRLQTHLGSDLARRCMLALCLMGCS
jgi:hypothetical protein